MSHRNNDDKSNLGIQSHQLSQVNPDTGRAHVVPALGYDLHVAEAAERRELEMTFWECLKSDRRLIWYTVFFSGTIVMEGYGLALSTYLNGYESFREKFGAYLPDPTHPGEYSWQLGFLMTALLPLMPQFGSLIGIFLTSPITRAFGYKVTAQVMLMLSGAFICVPFFAKSVDHLLVGYFLQGIPWGVYQVVSPAYASEVASLQLRPILTTWNNLCWVIGQLMAAAVGKGFEGIQGEKAYRVPFSLQWIFVAILLVAVSFAPESPYWYIQKNRLEDAKKSAKKLVRKGDDDLAEAKLALMQRTIHQEKKEDHGADGSKWDIKRFGALFRGSDRRRTEISAMTWIIQAVCGSSLIGWAPILMQSAGLSQSDAFTINIAIPLAGLVGTLASWWLMQGVGRRNIYLWGLVGMFGLLAACGFASFAPPDKVGWAAGGILIVFTLVYDLTVGPICYSIVSEIPSVRRRTPTLSIARGSYLAINLVNGFLTPKMASNESDAWGWGAKTGFFYAILSALGAVYTWWRIPETKDLSARELDILFHKRVKPGQFSRAKAAELDDRDPEEHADSDRSSLAGDRKSGLNAGAKTVERV